MVKCPECKYEKIRVIKEDKKLGTIIYCPLCDSKYNIPLKLKNVLMETQKHADDIIRYEEKKKSFECDMEEIIFDDDFDQKTIKEVYDKCVMVATNTIERIILKDLKFPELVRAMTHEEIDDGSGQGGGHGLYRYPDDVAINPHYSKNFNFMCGNFLHEEFHYAMCSIGLKMPKEREIFWHEGLADFFSEIIAKRISKDLYDLFVMSNEMRQDEYRKNPDVDIFKQRALGYLFVKMLDKNGCLIKSLRYSLNNNMCIEKTVSKFCNISQKKIDNFFKYGKY